MEQSIKRPPTKEKDKKRLAFLGDKLITYGNEFRILAPSCEHWDQPEEWKPAICFYSKNPVDCTPFNCPWRAK